MLNETTTPQDVTLIRFQRHGSPEVEVLVILGIVNSAIFDNFAWSKVIQTK
jgi:hypothetical protein